MHGCIHPFVLPSLSFISFHSLLLCHVVSCPKHKQMQMIIIQLLFLVVLSLSLTNNNLQFYQISSQLILNQNPSSQYDPAHFVWFYSSTSSASICSSVHPSISIHHRAILNNIIDQLLRSHSHFSSYHIMIISPFMYVCPSMNV
jgi:heme exporter protein D